LPLSVTLTVAVNSKEEPGIEERSGAIPIVIQRDYPLPWDQCQETASALRLMTVEEVWAVVLQMPTDKDEYEHTFPNGNALILKRK